MAIQDIQESLDKIKQDINTTGIQDSSGNNLVSPGTYNPSNGIITTPSNGLNLPSGSPQTSGIDGVGGMINYWKTQYETSIQQQKDEQAKLDAQRETQKTQTQPWYKNILGSKSPEQTRQEATDITGINPTNYFAEEKSSLAELDTLNADYNKTVAARDTELANIEGRPIPMSEIIGAKQVAEKNWNARLNLMAANINSKAATFQAKQGMFNEAQTYINNAVSAATADQKYNMDMYDYFYKENQDIIDKLDVKIQNAYKESQTAAQNAWTTAVSEKSAVGELMINPDYAGAGVTINDTLDQANAKIAKYVTSPAYLTRQAQLSQKTYEPPSSYQEWVLAGKPGTYADFIKKGDDKLLSTSDAEKLGVPYGTTQQEAIANISFKNSLDQLKKEGKTKSQIEEQYKTENGVSVIPPEDQSIIDETYKSGGLQAFSENIAWRAGKIANAAKKLFFWQ